MNDKPCQSYMHDTFFCIGCPIKECEYYKKHNKKVLDDWIKPFVDSVNERFKRMWQIVDYNGNTVKWYEAELIEKIKKICNEALYIATKTDNLGSYNEILAIIQENER